MLLKSRICITLAAFISIYLLTGCSGIISIISEKEEASHSSVPEAHLQTEDIETDNDTETVFTKSFGTYTVPAGWSEVDEYSTDEKFFYMRNDVSEKTMPDNVSIEIGENKYALDEHMQFKDAIVRQLSMQLKDIDVTVEGSGSYTEHDDVMYEFKWTFPDDSTMNGAVATQYYIVGNYKYVMIYETAWNDITDTDNVAQSILNSFVWSEEE